MSEPMRPREVRGVEELRALAHPMRQRILRRLHDSGPATSTTLARDLGENSGIMSYHLRLLAEHDFVREVPGRGQGRERWWEASPQPAWIPREGLSIEAQAEVSGLRTTVWADALEGFGRFRAARQAMGEWGQGTWVLGHTKLTLTREESVHFIADQQELVRRYQRDAGDAPAGARTVVFASATYPEPTPDEESELPGAQAARRSAGDARALRPAAGRAASSSAAAAPCYPAPGLAITAGHVTIGPIMENPPAHFPAWPGDAEVAVALTFDVDGEAPWLSEGPGYDRRLTLLSQGRFGPARGLGRVLALLAELGVPATFYVPGHTADQHPQAVEAIVAGGHEVAHHGYLHRGTDGLDAAAQRAELEQGLAALGRLGVRPDGYRSPGWELTPETLDLLGELGFSYDASLMADDRPYWVSSATGPLLELPGHWSLCDWPYFGWTSYHGGLLADPAAVERTWLAEFDSGRRDRRAVTYTMHPEAIGRGYLIQMLDSVITAMAGQGRTWFATHAQIAQLAGTPSSGSP